MLITKHQVGVSKHIGNYSDSAVVGPNARWLHISGNEATVLRRFVTRGKSRIERME